MRDRKQRLHLIYAVPYAEKFRMLTGKGVPLYRKYWRYSIPWLKPVPAPQSITYNILKTLSKSYEVLLYHVDEKQSLKLGNNDIVLGHFWPDMRTKENSNNNWTRYDPEQITNAAILNYPYDKRIFVMTPFNHSTEQSGWAIPLMKQAHHYIGICGDYWVDTLDQSAYAFLQGKMSHLNMGIDIRHYPKVKTGFSKAGKRKFLYIGRISKEKNIDMLEAIAASNKNFYGGYIGKGVIKGWHQISSSAVLTSKFMSKLALEYDFFINASNYDAQATTVLEAMSWGFVVACTPQSGYVEESIFRLSTNNVEHNIKIIELMNSLDENELQAIVHQYQILLRKKYTWEKFTDKLIKILSNEFIQTN